MKKEQTNSEKESWLLKKAAELGITFIDLKRDFAFKWMFGTSGHEEELLLLLKSLLPEKHIVKVKLGPQEQKPDREDARSGVFDILCETDDGSILNIEMQVCPQVDFNDRMVFYSSFLIRDHIGQGVSCVNGQPQHYRYKLPLIYTIGILDFELEGIPQSNRVIRHFSIREDDDNSSFTDSIHYITVELPKFNKDVSILSSTQDFMLYLLKHSGVMREIPKEFNGKGFDKFLERCMFANMTESEQMDYMRQMKAEWDRENQLNCATQTAELRGQEEGRQLGHEDVARAMKAEGFPGSIISKCTGLTLEQIASL